MVGHSEKNLESNPLISVVTVVLNEKEKIRKTIDSVLGQSYKNIEFIVIDGGSTDGTLEVVRLFEKQINFWISEPDKGIYDAMNKGIGVASGDWIIFMNAGDTFFNSSTVSHVFQAKNLGRIIYGDTAYVYDEFFSKIKKGPEEISFKFCLPFNHQSCFVRTSLLQRRSFNTFFKIHGDLDLFLYFFYQGEVFSHIPVIIARYDYNGRSLKFSLRNFKEKFKINKLYRQNSIQSFYWHVLITCLRFLLKEVCPGRLVRLIQRMK